MMKGLLFGKRSRTINIQQPIKGILRSYSAPSRWCHVRWSNIVFSFFKYFLLPTIYIVSRERISPLACGSLLLVLGTTIHWLQQSERGQQAVKKTALMISPRAKERVRRVRFLSEEDDKILEASKRTKPNKVQRRKNKTIQSEEEKTDITPASHFRDGVTTTISVATATVAPIWSETSLMLLRSALKSEEANKTKLIQGQQAAKSNEEALSSMVSKIHAPDSSKLESSARSTSVSSSTTASFEDSDFAQIEQDEITLGNQSQHSQPDRKASTINEPEDILDLSGACDNVSPKPSNRIARAARDSLLLSRMDPPKRPTDADIDCRIQPQLFSLPSLEECPSDEHDRCWDDNTDSIEGENEDTFDEAKIDPENSYDPSATKTLKGQAANTAQPTPLSLPLSPTSRPLGLSNRAT